MTFTFSEAPVGFTLEDVMAENGTLSGLAATADPTVFFLIKVQGSLTAGDIIL